MKKLIREIMTMYPRMARADAERLLTETVRTAFQEMGVDPEDCNASLKVEVTVTAWAEQGLRFTVVLPQFETGVTVAREIRGIERGIFVYYSDDPIECNSWNLYDTYDLLPNLSQR